MTHAATPPAVRVTVQVAYQPGRSDPTHGVHFFAYTITITNEGPTACQLISRHWIITDAIGHMEEVRGPGVVGQQPLLAPGQSFSYTSGCPLPTPVGSMRGAYQMVDSEGRGFEVAIPAFALAQALAVN